MSEHYLTDDDWTMDDLVKAVRAHHNFDDEQMREIAEHGADTGWPGFTMTSECCEFFDKHALPLWEMLQQQAEDMGEGNVCEHVAKFKRSDMIEHWDMFRNLLAWWALEEAARYVTDQKDN